MKTRKRIACLLLASLVLVPLPVKAGQTISDYENVYVIQKSSGEVKKVISVDWIRVEGEGDYTIIDPVTAGSSPQLLLGDAAITKIDNGVEIRGRSYGLADVFYRQEVNKAPPFVLRLDIYNKGSKVQWEDLAESTGTIDIVVTFENQYKDGDLYMPWLVNMNLSLDGRSVRDLAVQNGRVMQLGSKLSALLTLQCIDESVTASISYVAVLKTEPNLSISVMPVLMTPTVPNLAELGKLSDGLAAAAKGIDGYALAITKIAQSVTTSFTTGAMDNVSLLLDMYSHILSSIYAQIDQNQVNALKSVPETLRSLSTPLRQTASAAEQMALLVDAYMQAASQALALNKQIGAVLSQEELKNRLVVNELLHQQELLLNTLTYGATLPTGNIPSLATLKASLLTLKDNSTQLARALDDAANMLAPVDTLATGLVSIKDTIGVLIHGGTVNGQTIPAMHEVSNSVSESAKRTASQLSRSMSELKNALQTLVSGGNLYGQKVPPMGELSHALRTMSAQTKQAYDESQARTSSLNRARELAEHYKSFSGIPAGAKGQVMFVVKIEDK
ncbi:hypothetical protein HPY42_01310 [Coprothermobacteraceae bacterium]|nr:hypothetical protein [Coprothermobacteraceae bacterium]